MTETNLTPAMNLFINDVRQVVRVGGGEQVVTKKIAARLRSLLQERDVLDPRYTRPKPDKPVGYPVWVEPDGSSASPQSCGT